MQSVKCKNREEWLLERMKSIGASDCPTMMGVSAYKGGTLLKLYADKTGELPSEQETPEWMEWGKRLEPLIAAKFTEETGFQTEDPGEFTIYRNYDTPFMHATPDHMILQDPSKGRGVLQLKAPGSHYSNQWIEGPPLGVEIQVQAEMHSCDADWGAVAALIGGQSFRWALCERNHPFIDKLIGECRDFWEGHVVPRVPPEAEAGDLALLARMFPLHTIGVTVDCTEEMLRHVGEYDILAEEIVRAQKTKDYHEAKMKNFMQHAEKLLLDDGSSFTWKGIMKKEYTVPAHDERQFRRKAAPKK